MPQPEKRLTAMEKRFNELRYPEMNTLSISGERILKAFIASEIALSLKEYQDELVGQVEKMKDVLMDRGSLRFPRYDEATLDEVISLLKEKKCET